MTPGSSTKPGHLYHEPAFPTDRPFQRGRNQERLDILLAHEDWFSKHVVDWGCSAGYFTMKLAQAGATVYGFDADPQAIAFARQQALEHGVKKADFNIHDFGGRYFHVELDPEVMLALSVIPWLIKTEPNHWQIIRELFAAPTAYVELMYAGDGRAGMAEVRNDEEAQVWLEQFYPTVYPIGMTMPDHNGDIPRTIWRCTRLTRPSMAEDEAEADFTGAQAFVWLRGAYALKRGRPGRAYDPLREEKALRALEGHYVAPRALQAAQEGLLMTRLYGRTLHDIVLKGEGPPLTGEQVDKLAEGFEEICQALERTKVRHRDVRPENIMVTPGGVPYLLDFGWATIGDEELEVPEGINPEHRADTDRGSFKSILRVLYETLE